MLFVPSLLVMMLRWRCGIHWSSHRGSHWSRHRGDISRCNRRAGLRHDWQSKSGDNYGSQQFIDLHFDFLSVILKISKFDTSRVKFTINHSPCHGEYGLKLGSALY
jgi:hypothetical protein